MEMVVDRDGARSTLEVAVIPEEDGEIPQKALLLMGKEKVLIRLGDGTEKEFYSIMGFEKMMNALGIVINTKKEARQLRNSIIRRKCGFEDRR